MFEQILVYEEGLCAMELGNTRKTLSDFQNRFVVWNA